MVVAPMAFLSVFFLVPLVITAVFSVFTRDPLGSFTYDLTLDNFARVFGSEVYTGIVMGTLKLAAITTLVTLPLAYGLAYWLTLVSARVRQLSMFIIILSLWSNVIIRAFAWLIILGDNGVVNRLLSDVGLGPYRLAFNELGVLIGLVHVMVPMMMLPIYASLRSIDPPLLQAASGLGASRRRAFLRVTLPLSMSGVTAGLVLVFVVTSGYFLTPAVLGGGRVQVVASIVIQQIGLLNYPFAAALSVILVVVVITVAMILGRVLHRLSGTENTGMFNA